MGSLANKCVLVTGAEQGIGKAVAEQLIRAGCNVAMHYYNGDSVDDLIALAKSKNQKVLKIQADFTENDSIHTCVKEAVSFLGSIDILVNNVGGLVGRRTIEEIDNDFWHHVMNLNMTSMMQMTKAVLPNMQNLKEGASIVNIASLAGRKGGHSGSLAYSTSKGAVITWTRALSAELAPFGIRVNCVAPGLILGTRFHRTHTTDASAKETIKSIPLGRAGTPDDVARSVRFLASEYDGFITGMTLDINGGVYCA